MTIKKEKVLPYQNSVAPRGGVPAERIHGGVPFDGKSQQAAP